MHDVMDHPVTVVDPRRVCSTNIPFSLETLTKMMIMDQIMDNHNDNLVQERPETSMELQSSSKSRQSMDDWLSIQEEKLQNQIVNVQSGMTITPNLYFGTRRSTYSDVISIVTTSIVSSSNLNASSSSSSKQRNSDYRPPLTRTEVENPLKSGDPHQRSSREQQRRHHHHHQLLAEHAAFMTTLAHTRDARRTLEHHAASAIQRIFRGHFLRCHFHQLRKTLVRRRRIRAGLSRVTQGSTLVVAESSRRRAKEARVLEACLNIQRWFRISAASLVRRGLAQKKMWESRVSSCGKIQALARQAGAARATRKIRRVWTQAREARASTVIAAATKGFLTRVKLIPELRRELERTAVVMLQSQMRRVLATKRLCFERQARVEVSHNAAAVRLQTLYRRHTAELRVRNIRVFETRAIACAAALTLQRVTRGNLARARALARRYRVREEHTLEAVLRIQSQVRQFLGKCRALHKVAASLGNIYLQTRLGRAEIVDDLFHGFGSDTVHTPESYDPETGHNVLTLACKFGHKTIARKCLRWGFDLNVENLETHETPLWLAVSSGHGDLAEYLLAKRAHVRSRGRTLAHVAASQRALPKSTLEGILTLVESSGGGGGGSSESTTNNLSAFLDERDPESGDTALHEAARSGNVMALELLLSREAKIEVTNAAGSTVVHVAAHAGQSLVLAFLCQWFRDHHDVDTSVQLGLLSALDGEHRSAWRVALSKGQESCAKILREWLMNLNYAAAEGGNVVEEEDQVTLLSAGVAAAVNGDTDQLEELLNRGLDPQLLNPESGNSLLMEGIAHESIVSQCRRWNISLEIENFEGSTALLLTTDEGAIERLLLPTGASMVAADPFHAHASTKRTIFHEMAKRGQVLVDYISARNLDINLQDARGWTPLHDASASGSTVAVRQLLHVGACAQAQNVRGETPLHLLAQVSQEEYRESSLTLGLEYLATAMDSGSSGPPGSSNQQPPPFFVDHDQRSVLHNASASGQVELCQQLLKRYQVSAHCVDAKGRSPAFDAVEHNHVACLKALLEVGGALAVSQTIDREGSSLLHHALASGAKADVLDVLFQLKPDLNQTTNPGGQTLLHVAAGAGNVIGLRRVLAAHGDHSEFALTQINQRGDTPVVHAIRQGQDQSLSFFMEKHHHHDSKTLEEMNPTTTLLHIAAQASVPSLEVIRCLFDAGFSITAVDNQGQQPLHRAVVSAASRNGEQEGILGLLLCGAPVNSETELSHMTPLHLAAQAGNTLGCLVLMENGANDKATVAVSATEKYTAAQLATNSGMTATALAINEFRST